MSKMSSRHLTKISSVLLKNSTYEMVINGRQLTTTCSNTCSIGETWPERRESKSSQWNRIIVDAEKNLGYPNILVPEGSDLRHDLVELSTELRKIVGTSHPLMTTAKRLIYGGQHNMQARGILILTWAKAISNPETEREKDVIKKENYLATLTELLHGGLLIHSGVVDVEGVFGENDIEIGNVRHANKLAILIGDLMLAKANLLLGKMENPKIVYDMTEPIRDFMKGEFVFKEDRHGQEYPSESQFVKMWETRTFLRNASLMANALRALHISNGMDEKSSENAYGFGRTLSMGWKASMEFQELLNRNRSPEGPFSLVSLPVMMQLKNDPALLELVIPHHQDLSKVDYKKVFEMVSSEAIEEARSKCSEYLQDAFNHLQELPKSKSKEILQNVISALEV